MHENPADWEHGPWSHQPGVCGAATQSCHCELFWCAATVTQLAQQRRIRFIEPRASLVAFLPFASLQVEFPACEINPGNVVSSSSSPVSVVATHENEWPSRATGSLVDRGCPEFGSWAVCSRDSMLLLCSAHTTRPFRFFLV
jgi:hypothetical protein